MSQYPTNLTDKQWQVTEIILDPQHRKRKYSLRDIMDAIMYIVKTECQWRMLPRDFRPLTPSSTTSTNENWARSSRLSSDQTSLQRSSRFFLSDGLWSGLSPCPSEQHISRGGQAYSYAIERKHCF